VIKRLPPARDIKTVMLDAQIAIVVDGVFGV
jgi:hypothetical protein